MPAFSNIRKSSFHRRSGASFSAEDRVSQSTGGGGSLGQFDKDLDDLDAPKESAEVQWADEEDNGNDESFIDRMAKKSFAHFIALIQRRLACRYSYRIEFLFTFFLYTHAHTHS